MSEQGLGRRHAPDERDRKYALPRTQPRRDFRMWASDGVLDQGATPQCVGYSTLKYLTSSPIINKPSLLPVDLYHEAQKVDEWPGEGYAGTSVRAAFKVLKSLGFVSEYRWAFDVHAAVAHIINTGPVVMGSAWSADLSNPDRQGYIHAGNLDTNSGHAWLVVGANLARRNPDKTVGAVRMVNSWGPDWGPHRGRAWITLRDFDKLIKADGECAVATEIKQEKPGD